MTEAGKPYSKAEKEPRGLPKAGAIGNKIGDQGKRTFTLSGGSI
jgi:hypothetical protein